MSHSLSLNQSISSSLTYLDLSGNSLKDDITVWTWYIQTNLFIWEHGDYVFFFFQNLHNFLAQPNVLEYLDLSATDTTLENVIFYVKFW